MLLPNDICTDGKGNLFLADPDSYRIIHVDSALKPRTLHTVPGRAVVRGLGHKAKQAVLPTHGFQMLQTCDNRIEHNIFVKKQLK